MAGILQAVNWVKESWRKGGEPYWNSWMHLDDCSSAALIVFVHLYKHAFPSKFIWLYWSYHPGRTVWDNTFLCSGMCYIELYILTWLIIWYQENWSAIRLSFCCFCWLQVFFRCSCKCFPLPILFYTQTFVPMPGLDFKTAFIIIECICKWW